MPRHKQIDKITYMTRIAPRARHPAATAQTRRPTAAPTGSVCLDNDGLMRLSPLFGRERQFQAQPHRRLS